MSIINDRQVYQAAYPRRRGAPSLELHLSRAKFATGRHLSGVVVFRLSKPTDLRALTVSVSGCEAPAGAAFARALRKTGSFFHRDILLSGRFQPRLASDRVSELWNAVLGRDKGRTLSAGEYTYPFSFLLPASLPPSYQGKAGRISYRVCARVQFPVGRSLQVSAEVPVVFVPRDQRGRPVALSYPTAGGTIHSASTTINLNLSQRVAELGRSITGRFVIRNPHGTEISRVMASLETCEWVRLAAERQLQREQADSCAIVPGDPRALVIESDFDLQIPPDASPTVEGMAISVIWLLKLSVDTSPPLELKTPITVHAPVPED